MTITEDDRKTQQKDSKGKEKKSSHSSHNDNKESENIDNLENLRKESQKNKSTSQKDDQRVFNPSSFLDLLERPLKKWIVEDLIGDLDLGMIYGASGIGKTFVVIELIVCASIGKNFADSFCIKKPLNVAYFAGEGISALPDRFKAAATYHGIKDLANFTFYDITPQLFETDTTDKMTHFLYEHKTYKEKPFDIIFIDTFHSATVGADENSAKDAGKILSMCKLASKELQCSVVLVHHMNKNETGERGSSSLRGAMDFMIEISGNSGAAIRCAKLKDGKAWKPIGFDLCDTEGCNSAHVEWKKSVFVESKNLSVKEADKQKLIEQMELHEGHHFTVKELAELLKKSDTQVRPMLQELFNEKRCKGGLVNSKNKQSSTNPFLYWIDPY